jgi:hypothetical protein
MGVHLTEHVPWACMGLHLIGIEFMGMRLVHASHA